MLQTLLGRIGIYYSKRQYMPYGIDWLWDLARLNPPVQVRTVIDVGANEGQTVSAIAMAFPGVQIHAFEPIAATFEVLQHGFGSNPKVRLNRLAVSSAVGTVQMNAAAYSPASHIVSAPAAGDRVVSVATITLDAYCEQHGITHIDILKTDTEGHDVQVLRGARRLLSEGRIDWVLTEATFNPDDTAHSQFAALSEWLGQYGMTPWGFYEQFHIAGGRRLMFLNVLFAKRLPAGATPS